MVPLSFPGLVYGVSTVQLKFILNLNRFLSFCTTSNTSDASTTSTPSTAITSLTSFMLLSSLLLLLHSTTAITFSILYTLLVYSPTHLLVYSSTRLLAYSSTRLLPTPCPPLPTPHSLHSTIYSSPSTLCYLLFPLHSLYSICFDQLSLSIIRLIRTLFALGERKHHSVCLSIICECYSFHRASTPAAPSLHNPPFSHPTPALAAVACLVQSRVI